MALAIIVCFTSLTAFSQASVKIGAIQNGVAVVTDINEATRVLKAGLSPQATIFNISIGYCKGDQNYYLIAQVSNDPVSGKGIQLHAKGELLYAVAGPGVEVTCNGENCRSCMIDLKGLRPICTCFVAGEGPGEVKCDMQSKVTIGF